MPKGIPKNKKVEEVDDLEEIDEALKEDVTAVESHPDYDPDLPENKQRGLR